MTLTMADYQVSSIFKFVNPHNTSEIFGTFKGLTGNMTRETHREYGSCVLYWPHHGGLHGV